MRSYLLFIQFKCRLQQTKDGFFKEKRKSLYALGLITVLVGMQFVPAQAQQHHNAWFRATLSVPVAPSLMWDHELQHRRQNGNASEHLLAHNLMYTYRMWLHFQHNTHWKFSFSPTGYFYHYKIIETEGDVDSKPVKEYRLTSSAEWQNQCVKGFRFIIRGGIEYRMFEGSRQDVLRFRLRNGLKWAYNENVQLMLFDEIFINGTTCSSGLCFDHNRVVLELDYRIGPQLKVDTGWMYINRRIAEEAPVLLESNVFLQLTYTFRHRKWANL